MGIDDINSFTVFYIRENVEELCNVHQFLRRLCEILKSKPDRGESFLRDFNDKTVWNIYYKNMMQNDNCIFVP